MARLPVWGYGRLTLMRSTQYKLNESRRRKIPRASIGSRTGRVPAKRIAVKKHVAKLSDEEWEQLNALIYAGKHPARRQTKAAFC